jgi:hypothetical protein
MKAMRCLAEKEIMEACALYDSLYISTLDGCLLELQIYHYKANDITNIAMCMDPTAFFTIFYSTWTVLNKNCFNWNKS